MLCLKMQLYDVEVRCVGERVKGWEEKEICWPTRGKEKLFLPRRVTALVKTLNVSHRTFSFLQARPKAFLRDASLAQSL